MTEKQIIGARLPPYYLKMENPISPKHYGGAPAASRARPETGTSTKMGIPKMHVTDSQNGVNQTAPAYHSRHRLSDISVASTLATPYLWSDRLPPGSPHSLTESVPASPHREQLATPRASAEGSAWTGLPSLRPRKYLDSTTKGFVMTPRSAAYLRKLAQQSHVSVPTSAGSLPTASAEVTEADTVGPAPGEEPVEEVEVKAEVEVRPPAEEEPAILPPQRIRRQPWIGPAYTAVHRPPYTPQTWEYGRVENLLETGKPESLLSEEEQQMLIRDMKRLNRREALSMVGRQHYEPYPHRAPAAGSYLEDYPVPLPKGGHSFEKDPLLRSVLKPHDNLPYMRDVATYCGQPFNYWYNDWMLDNKMYTALAKKYCPDTFTAYADIPNFGRVQSVLMKQPDGTTYPLVTLPKMTPYDIIKVLDKMKRTDVGQRQVPQRPWYSLFCCCMPDTVDD